MSIYKIPEFHELLFKIGIIVILGGVPALIGLVKVLPVVFGMMFQLLPLFKWDLVILGLKILWNFI